MIRGHCRRSWPPWRPGMGCWERVWITDRGMASADNLAWLRQTGRRYIIGAPKSELKKFSSALATADGWRTVHEGVEVKLTRNSETGETVILCRSADRRSAAAPGCALGSCEEARRSDNGESADRPHPAAKPAFCRPICNHAGAGWLSRGFPPWRRLQRRLRRLGRALRGRLSPAFQHHRLERSTAVEGLHPAHPGRGGLPYPEGSAKRAPDLAPARRTRAGSYPRLLSRFRAVEEPRDVAEPRRSRQFPAHYPGRTCAHSVA